MGEEKGERVEVAEADLTLAQLKKLWVSIKGMYTFNLCFISVCPSQYVVLFSIGLSYNERRYKRTVSVKRLVIRYNMEYICSGCQV